YRRIPICISTPGSKLAKLSKAAVPSLLLKKVTQAQMTKAMNTIGIIYADTNKILNAIGFASCCPNPRNEVTTNVEANVMAAPAVCDTNNHKITNQRVSDDFLSIMIFSY